MIDKEKVSVKIRPKKYDLTVSTIEFKKSVTLGIEKLHFLKYQATTKRALDHIKNFKCHKE